MKIFTSMAILFSMLSVWSQQLSTVPLFQTCSIYFETGDLSGQCSAEFREKGSDTWHKVFELVKNQEQKIPYKDRTYIDKPMFRGSIVNLKEDTVYELKITYALNGKKNIYTNDFRTWSSNPPVKKTVNVKDIKFDGELIITEKGTKDAWIKYVSDDGFAVKGNDVKNAAVSLRKAEYIILENLTVQGGLRHGISLEESNNIRVINCDISGFGRVGRQDLAKDGKYYTPDGKMINYDAGVNIAGSSNVVVEKCYIHDPRNRANSWKFSHPAGPTAVFVHSKGATVLRYNDFIGSDPHRWNDVVEGYGNGVPDGGFFRDAEIYGNIFIYGNDDGMELDGGQMNVKVFLNRFEGSFCGISTAPCTFGPSYIFRNLISNLGDDRSATWAALKNKYNTARGRIFFFNNTICGNLAYSGYEKREKEKPACLKGFTRNNIFQARKGYIAEEVFQWKNDFDYDLFYGSEDKEARASLHSQKLEQHGIFDKNPAFENPADGNYNLSKESPALKKGIKIDNFIEDFKGDAPDLGAFESGMDTILPYRPIPVFLDKYQVNIDARKENGNAVRAFIKQGKEYHKTFTIRRNNVFDWFSVEPAEGVIKENTAFKITLNKDKMKTPGLYKGLFLIKFADGYSRPVTVYADNGPLPDKK